MSEFPPQGEVFPLAEIRKRREQSGELYLEFLRIPEMSVGFYALPASGVDPQTPHREDEIYYVIRGRATISISGEDRPVAPGATIFVAKGADHRFHSVSEPLELLVVFAPEESSEPKPPHSPPADGRNRRSRPRKGS
jgi:mannose-6-phosphate isomerase-like protein (cupin superfamily)